MVLRRRRDLSGRDTLILAIRLYYCVVGRDISIWPVGIESQIAVYREPR
jgi:hypothetical protein